MDKVKKSRNRVPTSCSVCRRKKMKCSKERPFCSECVKSSSTNTCHYTERPWEYLSTEKQLSNEVLRLKIKINQLENVIRRHNIDVSAESSPAQSNSASQGEDTISPNSSISCHSSRQDDPIDPTLALASKFDSLVIKENKFMHFGTTSYMAIVNSDIFLRKMFQRYLQMQKNNYFADRSASGQPYQPNEMRLEGKEKEVITCGGEFPLRSDLMPNYEESGNKLSDKFLKMMDAINQILFPIDAVYGLVDVFFDRVYPLLPFMDEKRFRKDLDSILFMDEYNNAKIVVRSYKLNPVAALLLIVLRFAYLTLSSSTDTVNESLKGFCEGKLTVGPVFVEHAKSFLINTPGQENILRNVSLQSIQVILYLRLYRVHAPEDGDESNDSPILLAMLIQMCKMHGMYRDPKNFDLFKDVDAQTIWRRIWYKVLQLDSLQALQFGCNLIVSTDDWDTSLPYLDRSNEIILSNVERGMAADVHQNVINRLLREKQINSDIASEYELTLLVRKVCKMCQSVHSEAKRSDFEQTILEIDNMCERKFCDKSSKAKQVFLDSLSENPSYKGGIAQISLLKEFDSKGTLYTLRCVLNYVMFLTCSSDLNQVQRCIPDKFSLNAMESALILFKRGFDFMKSIAPRISKECELPAVAVPKTLFTSYEFLVGCNIPSSATRGVQILISLSLRQEARFFSFSEALKSFSNSSDSLEILNWFNVTLYDVKTKDQVSLDEQFAIVLFRYILEMYSMALPLQEKFFSCWRTIMVIKVYINYLKHHHKKRFESLMRSYEIFKNDEQNVSEFLEMSQDVVMSDIDLSGLIYETEEDFYADLMGNSLSDQQNEINYLNFDFDPYRTDVREGPIDDVFPLGKASGNNFKMDDANLTPSSWNDLLQTFSG